MKTKNSKAFTIIEVLIVVTVVAVLSSLAVISYTSVRQDSRDAARQGNVTVISEALEKYYEKNGEYPSVASLTNTNPANTGTTIAQRLSIDPENLAMPQMPSSITNPLTASPEPHNDYIVYIGQSAEDNDRCQNDVNGGCDQYELRYQKEAGDTEIVESRRASRVVIQQPDITVVAAGPTQINATWTSLPDASSYTLQRSLSANMSSPVTTSHMSTSAAATGLLANTTYYFRVQANFVSSSSNWSDVQSATTNGVPTPSGTLTITAAISGSNAVGTAGGASCPAGMTIERQIRYNSTNTGTAGAWSSYVAGSTRSVAASPGWRYTFQQQARCASGGNYSGWISSETASVLMPISAPSGTLTISAAMSGSTAVGTAGGGSCPIGMTIERQIRYHETATSTDGAWSSYTTGTTRSVTASEGWKYTFQQQARCVSGENSSSWVSSGTAFTVRPINAPATPSIWPTPTGNTTTWTFDTACPSGTTRQFQGLESANYNPGYSGNWGPQGGNTLAWVTLDGHTYNVRAQARCYTVHTTGPWSGLSGDSVYVRPVAPPTGTITFTHTYLNNRYSRQFAYTPPTCRSASSPVYRWNSYMEGWNWAYNGQPGWYYGGYSSNYVNLWSAIEYNDPNTFTSPSAYQYPYGLKVQMRVQYRCHNYTTNLFSDFAAPVNSQIFSN